MVCAPMYCSVTRVPSVVLISRLSPPVLGIHSPDLPRAIFTERNTNARPPCATAHCPPVCVPRGLLHLYLCRRPANATCNRPLRCPAPILAADTPPCAFPAPPAILACALDASPEAQSPPREPATVKSVQLAMVTNAICDARGDDPEERVTGFHERGVCVRTPAGRGIAHIGVYWCEDLVSRALSAP